MTFCYDSYGSLLSSLKADGYISGKLDGREVPINSKILRLRHDVDTDILGVLPLAAVEESVGFASTWYFLYDNPIYNLFSDEVMSIVNKLVVNGHTVGLHVDAARYSDFHEMKESMNICYSLFNQLSKACGFESNLISKVFSFHRPAQWLLENNVVIDDWVNAYRDDYFGMNEKVVYISDSNRREFWKEDRINIARDSNRNITLLTHPAWWHNNQLDSDKTFDYLVLSLGAYRTRKTVAGTAKRYAIRMPEENIRC